MAIMTIDRGDLVYISLDPQAGNEQTGRRPAIVLSPKRFNEVTGLVSVCPIRSNAKGWGYEVELPQDLVFNGVILTDQLKNLDWSARRIEKKGEVPPEIVDQCFKKIHTFLSW